MGRRGALSRAAVTAGAVAAGAAVARAAARAGAAGGAARAGRPAAGRPAAGPGGPAAGRPAAAGPRAYPPVGPRVVVGGISGTGKSTVARVLAERLGVPHVELDAHAHQAGWRFASDDEMRASVGAAIAGDAWVVDGNYPSVREMVWERATTFVWLDFPRGVATWRAARRTVPRVLRRQELWNGNREEWRSILDPGHPIWWSWTHHPVSRATYEGLTADPRFAHVAVIRLRTPREADAWLHYAAQP